MPLKKNKFHYSKFLVCYSINVEHFIDFFQKLGKSWNDKGQMER